MYKYTLTTKDTLLSLCENENVGAINKNKAGKFEHGVGRLVYLTNKLKNKVKDNNDYFIRNGFRQRIKIIVKRTWESKLHPSAITQVFPRDFQEQVVRTTFLIFI